MKVASAWEGLIFMRGSILQPINSQGEQRNLIYFGEILQHEKAHFGKYMKGKYYSGHYQQLFLIYSNK